MGPGTVGNVMGPVLGRRVSRIVLIVFRSGRYIGLMAGIRAHTGRYGEPSVNRSIVKAIAIRRISKVVGRDPSRGVKVVPGAGVLVVPIGLVIFGIDPAVVEDVPL
jgi:hypothetical protein